MEPLKISFKITGGFVPPPYPLHLDALIAYALTQDGLDPNNPELPTDIASLRALADDLPFAKHEQDGEWVWMASALVPEGPINHDSRFFTQRMNKRELANQVGAGNVQMGKYEPDPLLRPGENMKPYQNKIDTLRGPFRNMLGYYPVMDVSEISAWCVGDREQIEEWLVHSGHITHLGARRRCGHGCIEWVTVEKFDEANELWKLRVRPWSMRDDDTPIQAAWNSPYWAAENKGQAFIPAILI